MVRMTEAGATIQQVSAVSGHSIEKSRKILATYIRRTYKMAQGAISAWENADAAAAAPPTAALPAAAPPVIAGAYTAEALSEMRERFGLSDQQIVLLQVTKAAESTNVAPPPKSNG